MKDILIPRTIRDFQAIDLLVASGFSNEKILEKMKTEWRSEVIQLAGRSLHCTECFQAISINACTECGQTIEENS